MHPRRAILDAIRAALAGATSPAYPVVEEDETASAAPCWQLAVGDETVGAMSTRADYEVQLELKVTARGSTPTERDSLSEALQIALLGAGSAGTLELEWRRTALARPREQVADRTYPATYELLATYFMGRN